MTPWKFAVQWCHSCHVGGFEQSDQMQGTVRRSYQNWLKTSHDWEATLIYSLRGVVREKWTETSAMVGGGGSDWSVKPPDHEASFGTALETHPNAHHHPWPSSFQRLNLSFLWEKEYPQALNVSGAHYFSTPCLSQPRNCPYSSARLYLTNNHTAVRYAS